MLCQGQVTDVGKDLLLRLTILINVQFGGPCDSWWQFDRKNKRNCRAKLKCWSALGPKFGWGPSAGPPRFGKEGVTTGGLGVKLPAAGGQKGVAPSR